MKPVQAAILKRTLQSSINQIQDVFASTVVLDEAGGVEEIHVLAAPNRQPKQIVRDIESLLMVKFHMRIDYRKVSLVQAEEDKILRMLGARPRLVQASYELEEGSARAEVILEDEGTAFRGEASAPVAEASPQVLAGRAVLEALRQLTGEEYDMHLTGIEVVEAGGKHVMVAVVTLLVPGGEEVLLGTAFVREATEDAASRAVLDAVNRRLVLIRRL